MACEQRRSREVFALDDLAFKLGDNGCGINAEMPQQVRNRRGYFVVSELFLDSVYSKHVHVSYAVQI